MSITPCAGVRDPGQIQKHHPLPEADDSATRRCLDRAALLMSSSFGPTGQRKAQEASHHLQKVRSYHSRAQITLLSPMPVILGPSDYTAVSHV